MFKKTLHHREGDTVSKPGGGVFLFTVTISHVVNSWAWKEGKKIKVFFTRAFQVEQIKCSIFNIRHCALNTPGRNIISFSWVGKKRLKCLLSLAWSARNEMRWAVKRDTRLLKGNIKLASGLWEAQTENKWKFMISWLHGSSLLGIWTDVSRDDDVSELCATSSFE